MKENERAARALINFNVEEEMLSSAEESELSSAAPTKQLVEPQIMWIYDAQQILEF